jgi:uncharacterized protein
LIVTCVISIWGCNTKKGLPPGVSLTEYREKYKEGFLQDPRSPLQKEDLAYLDFFEEAPEWKLQCKCTSQTDAKPFELPTYSGITRTYILHSIAKCRYKKEDIYFHIYKNITQPINPLYKNNLFLPFKDHTNGEESYGGGRYINLYTTDIQDGKIEIDFNKCYNPWCAYSDGYNCPIPPKENHLEREVRAGEKMYKGSYKKRDTK